MNTNDTHDGHTRVSAPALALFGLALSLGLGGCVDVDVDDAESFDDSDGAEEDEHIELRVIQDTCGDEPHGGPPLLCAQQCHNTYHHSCLSAASNELNTACRDRVEEHMGYPCAEEHLQPVPGECWQGQLQCRAGDWFPEYKEAYDDEAASCHDTRLDCLAQC